MPSSLPSNEPKKVKSYPQWHNFVAGAAAGGGARLITAPLDLLKIRRQLHSQITATTTVTTTATKSPSGVISNMSHIIKNEGGIKGLFRGNVAATYLWIGYAAVQFSLYAKTSNFLNGFALSHSPSTTSSLHNRNHHDKLPYSSLPSPSNKNPPILFQNLLSNIGSNPTATAFCSGATAGVAATLLTYPFDICRTVFAARGITSTTTSATSAAAAAAASASVNKAAKQIAKSPHLISPPKTIYQFGHDMYAKNGFRGFFAGSVPAIIQIIPYMGINFALYDYLMRVGTGGLSRKKDNENSSDPKVKAIGAGMAGFIAGGTSKILVHPLDTVKKRLQAQTFLIASSSSTISNAPSAGAMNLKYAGMLDCIATIAKEEGVLAFYKGLLPTALKSMIGTGCSFFFFTFTKNTLATIHDSVQKR